MTASTRPNATAALLAAAGLCALATPVFADALVTHRIPAALAAEAAVEAVAFCAKDGYRETAVVVDVDGARQAELRGDGAGIHTLDSANDKAYTSVTFRSDTLPLAERAKEPGGINILSKLPHVMFFGGGVVIKIGDEVVGAIGASGAPGAQLDEACARAGLNKIRDRLK
ncbi:MAG TPA: heme-binding protein [Xanthobacteraceae bacterium]